MCGITTPEDARLAVAAGAHAVGLVMYAPSPRSVNIAQAQQVCAAVPVFVSRVGLFVNATAEEINTVCSQVEFDLLQFHGDETNAFCASFNRPFIKALRIAPGDDVAAKVAEYPDSQGILLDAFTDGLYGGTGRSIDWQTVPALNTPVVLAGGLTPANVGDAIAKVQPHAVDVSGGIERAKGVKDADKIKDFMRAVRAADDARAKL